MHIQGPACSTLAFSPTTFRVLIVLHQLSQENMHVNHRRSETPFVNILLQRYYAGVWCT